MSENPPKSAPKPREIRGLYHFGLSKIRRSTPALGSAKTSENLCHFFIETRCVKDTLTSRIYRGCSALRGPDWIFAKSAISPLPRHESAATHGSIGLSLQNVHLKSMVRVPPYHRFETRYNKGYRLLKNSSVKTVLIFERRRVKPRTFLQLLKGPEIALKPFVRRHQSHF